MQRKIAISIRGRPARICQKRILFDTIGQGLRPSGPKGRRFKSCHLDQKSGKKVFSCPVFFCPLHKNTGFYRIADILLQPDCNGFCRIYAYNVRLACQFRAFADITKGSQAPQEMRKHIQFHQFGTGLKGRLKGNTKKEPNRSKQHRYFHGAVSSIWSMISVRFIQPPQRIDRFMGAGFGYFE